MPTINVQMTSVNSCTENKCAYNVNEACHARAITVGDSVTPNCDTFLNSKIHSRNIENRAGVGACKVSGCQHNSDFECQADEVEIITTTAGASCMTYSF